MRHVHKGSWDPLGHGLASWPGKMSVIREFPRSAILAVMAASRRTFLNERSLWITDGQRLCRCASPLVTS